MFSIIRIEMTDAVFFKSSVVSDILCVDTGMYLKSEIRKKLRTESLELEGISESCVRAECCRKHTEAKALRIGKKSSSEKH